MTIPELIDKQDGFEIIRDKIVQILVTESASQQALATAAGKDPNLWKLNIYAERGNPFEQWLNDPCSTVDTTPIVNVWYDSSTFPPNTSNVVGRQKSEGVFNIDCYGFAFSKADGAGHKPGDREAAYEVARALRLVRNILMAAPYTYLELRGTVWKRWIDSMMSFQPEFNERLVQNVRGGRIAFRVEFNDFSPQFAEETLEQIYTTIRRAEDGLVEIWAEVDIDYTAP